MTPPVWLAEAGFVFLAHSVQLWANPARAAARLTHLAAEKQKAFAEGAVKAGLAAARGAAPQAIAEAAVAPARRRVRANARKLTKG
ncbi:hypothetical protein BKE38_03635 [Pseudoroseomonas deserti]|uniref:Antifreeze protein n=1 Tax=Teichococcus deserti TaxID=1817963 RepID=A0A1V2H6M5_9PROT|nr:hypothetical protein [Pseudoroseomonas deserti]ONG58021.1 hypothetical protein BKE38_03635 [Pseudoroseomonas deserti]